MSPKRLFKESDFLQPADCEPIRSVITESDDAVVVAWYVKPGQQITAHVHPDGQDTWTILSGCGEYPLSVTGESIAIAQRDVLVAPIEKFTVFSTPGRNRSSSFQSSLPQHRALSRCNSS